MLFYKLYFFIKFQNLIDIDLHKIPLQDLDEIFHRF